MYFCAKENELEAYKEESKSGYTQWLFAYAALGLIALSWAYEAYQTFVLYRFSLMGWGYNLLFVVLWAWRCLFRYTYELTGKGIRIVMFGLCWERRIMISYDAIESFSNVYKRSFFRKTAIKKYVRRYSSVDPRPLRILVYKENGKLTGLLFKTSDAFLAQLRQRFPNQYLEFPE